MQVKTEGGIIRHSVQGTWVIEHRQGDQDPTVHISTDAKEIRHNWIGGKSLREATANSWRVVTNGQGCVPFRA